MAVTHISETDAIRDFAGVLARVQAGEEIVIDTTSSPISVNLSGVHRRNISQSIAIAESLALETGDRPVMDAGFAADMRDILDKRKPRDHSAWD